MGQEGLYLAASYLTDEAIQPTRGKRQCGNNTLLCVRVLFAALQTSSCCLAPVGSVGISRELGIVSTCLHTCPKGFKKELESSFKFNQRVLSYHCLNVDLY